MKTEESIFLSFFYLKPFIMVNIIPLSVQCVLVTSCQRDLCKELKIDGRNTLRSINIFLQNVIPRFILENSCN